MIYFYGYDTVRKLRKTPTYVKEKMRNFPLLCLLLAALLTGPALAASDSRLSDIEERRRNVAALMEAATVWVVGEDRNDIAQGSGFIVGEGFIATNAHVVDGLKKGAVIYVLNDTLPATKAQIVAVVHDDRKGVQGRDFALLRFSPPKGVSLPVLTFNLDAKRMDRVSAWGYPAMVTQFDDRTARLQEGDTRGLKAPPVVFTEGAINSIVSGKTSDTIIHSAQIASGNSGGPLVNSRGELVGMNTWGYTEEGEGAFLNAAQLANNLAVFLVANGVSPKLVPGQQVKGRYEPPVAQAPQKKPESESSRPSKFFGDRTRDVGSFTVEVPRNWSVEEEEKDNITLVSDDDSAFVFIMIEESGGLSLGQVAGNFADEFDGTRPVRDDDGDYSFSFVEEGMECMAFLSDLEDGRFILIVIGGDTDNPGLEQILDSVEGK